MLGKLMFRKVMIVLLIVFLLPLVDSWYNDSYEERYPHNGNNSGYTGIGYFGANVSGWYGTINNSGNSGQIYTYNDTNTGNLAVANDTDELCWFDTANDRSNCPKKTGSVSGLEAYWSFDGTNKDYIGGYDGTLYGSPSTVSGQVGDCYDFDGSNDYLTNDVLTPGGRSELTVQTWYNLDTTSQGTFMMSSDSGDFYFGMYGGDLGYYVRDNQGDNNKLSAYANEVTDRWIRATFVFDNGMIYVYRNGIQVHSHDTGATAIEHRSPDGLYLADGYWRNVDGNQDNTKFYSRALTSTEISNSYVAEKDKFPYLGTKETLAPVDTCSCPGAGNDWEIDMSDYCNITSDCNLTTGKLNFTGSGETRINATITTTDLGDPGANGILKILSKCLIWIN